MPTSLIGYLLSYELMVNALVVSLKLPAITLTFPLWFTIRWCAGLRLPFFGYQIKAWDWLLVDVSLRNTSAAALAGCRCECFGKMNALKRCVE